MYSIYVTCKHDCMINFFNNIWHSGYPYPLSYTACGETTPGTNPGGNGATSVVAVPVMIVSALVITLTKLF